jgi:hypothetical protein
MVTSSTSSVKHVTPLSLPMMGMHNSRSLWRTWK